LKSTNMLERLNEELRRCTRVVRIFPNAASCLRLIRALCVETHQSWREDKRYPNMDTLWEARKEQLSMAQKDHLHPQLERDRVELRHRCATGPLHETMSDRDGALAMICKLGLCAERSWRQPGAFELLAKIVDG
jgi:hypothetical protein